MSNSNRKKGYVPDVLDLVVFGAILALVLILTISVVSLVRVAEVSKSIEDLNTSVNTLKEEMLRQEKGQEEIQEEIQEPEIEESNDLIGQSEYEEIVAGFSI